MLTVCNARSAPPAGVSIQIHLGRSHLPRSFFLMEELSISSMQNLQGFTEQPDITLRRLSYRRHTCASGAATDSARKQATRSSASLRTRASSTGLVRGNAPSDRDWRQARPRKCLRRMDYPCHWKQLQPLAQHGLMKQCSCS